jgi:hypothetical protein
MTATTRPKVIGLSDSQLDIVRDAAAPLSRRSEFLEEVIRCLADCGELGDGIVARICRELAPKYFAPPDLRSVAHSRRRAPV